MKDRTFWDSLPRETQDEISTCLHMFLLADTRRWIERRVETIVALDSDAYTNRVSYQININAETFLEGLLALDLVSQTALGPYVRDSSRLVGQEVDLLLPIERFSKKVLLDFSVSGADGERLLILQRRDGAALSTKKLRLDLILALSGVGHYPADADHEIWDVVEDLDPIFHALVVSTSDHARFLYGRAGVAEDVHRATCRPPCRQKCDQKRVDATLAFFRYEIFARYLEEHPEDRAVASMILELAAGRLLDRIVDVARLTSTSVPGASGGLHNPIINPLLLCVEFMKAEEERSSGSGWGPQERVDSIESFFSLCERYCNFWMRLAQRERELGTARGHLVGAVYRALSEFKDHYVPYYRRSVRIGRSLMVKTDQVTPIVEPWTKRIPLRGYYWRRIGYRADRLYRPLIEWLRYLLVVSIEWVGFISRIDVPSRVRVWSKHKAIAYEIVLGGAKSCHVEVECSTATEMWQAMSRSFLTIGKRRVHPSRMFPYAASDARDRQHFYTTKSAAEILRVANGLRVGRRPVDALPPIKIWISYRLEPSLNFSYWMGVFLVSTTSLLFTMLYDPVTWFEPSRTRAPGFQPALLVGSTIVSFMMNWRAKESIVADRLLVRRMVALVVSLLTIMVFLVGFLFAPQFCAAKERISRFQGSWGQYVTVCTDAKDPAP